MRFDKRDFLRAAVFLCRVEPLAARSIRLCTTFWYLAAASVSFASAEAIAFLVKVRIMLLRARLAWRDFSDWRRYFIADLFLAIFLGSP